MFYVSNRLNLGKGNKRLTLAGGSLLRSGQTQVGKPKIGEHAQ
jgi:hypothetical protein